MGDTILEIKNLSIAFGGLKAVDNLSFSIERGQIYGLIGPNGAGKTTVFNCITQFYKADEGEVLFHHKDKTINLMDLKVDKVIDEGIVRTFQNVEIVRELSILDNVLVGAHKEYKSGLLQNIFQLPLVRQEEQEQIKKAEEILDQFGILHLKELPAGSQSYGIQKKVEFARALMSDPELIILDEPAAGLNDKETDEFAQLIRDIRDEYNCTILLVEHDMRLVMGICNSICAISFGKKITIGPPSEIQSNKEVQEAYLGVDAV